MKKIAVITSTRAEYGLLSPLIKELRKSENEDLKIDLIVTGTHLSEKYGKTINEIKNDGVRIDYEIPIPLNTGTAHDISNNQAEALSAFAEHFSTVNYSGIVVLGDRYEILAAAIAAGNEGVPIFHLCGGDTTEGAIDEWIRHSITKISYLHFPTNKESENRIIQLGEDPQRVFNYGSTSIDNIKSKATMSKAEALSSVSLPECCYAICTYHPETMDHESIEAPLKQILESVKKHPDIQFIFTKSNADCGGESINKILEQAEHEIENLHVYDSLGVKRYLSLVKYAEFVLGNSSSGIIEAPALKVPTVNIGDRQKGRTGSESIIFCKEKSEDISRGIDKALSEKFKQRCLNSKNTYGEGDSAVKIAAKILKTINSNIDLKKSFYNIDLK